MENTAQEAQEALPAALMATASKQMLSDESQPEPVPQDNLSTSTNEENRAPVSPMLTNIF